MNQDICGNESSGLFSYIQIGESSGVISHSSAISSTTSIATITVDQGTTVVVTSFVPGEPSTTLSSPGPTNQSDTSAVPMERSSFWESTGKVAGVFVVVGIVIPSLLVSIIWMCRSRRGKQDMEKSEDLPSTASRRISRTQPVSRSASLLQLIGRRDRSRHVESVSPLSVGNQRHSRATTDVMIPVVDQRLDPQSMMIRFDENDSRTSFRDEEDYSRRVWRVTNASDSDSLRSEAQ